MKQTRNTAQKKLIMELMRDNHTHPTADALYDAARERDTHISRGTVYRNLNQLDESNELRKLQMPMGCDHFDCRLDNHYHFMCRNCLGVFDTELEYKDELNDVPPGLDGFVTEWHRLILVGLCAECAKKQHELTTGNEKELDYV